MQSSNSRIECFETCARKYKLRYVDKLRVIRDYQADNALLLGTALHTGIEKDAATAIREYYFSFPMISNAHITEAMKLEMQIQKARALLSGKGEYEVPILTKRFKGFIDLLVPIGANTYNLYDFKYSNNREHYLKESRQLHLYKYYFEAMYPGKKIENLYFLFVPKNTSKQSANESLYHYRKRLLEELDGNPPEVVKVPFDYRKVIEHLELCQDVQSETKYEASKSWLCRYCDYYEFCQKGNDYMNLPSTERRNVGHVSKRKIWIYGSAFSGKTTMLDDAPNPLNLNTDGNIQNVTMPYIPIADEIKVEGHMTKRKYAWELFKEAIAELEKKQNDFETIIVDLLEDTREMCRVYEYAQLGIQHESDSGYGKGWDIVKTEYLTVMRRFFNLPYQNLVVVSHEDVSKDITKKNGQNITRVAPNIQEGIANKIAGMVDIVARVVVEDDGTRTLNFKSNEVIFGGGRLKGVTETSIPLSWDALMKVYEQSENSPVKTSGPPTSRKRSRNKDVPAETEKAAQESVEPATQDEPPTSVPEPETDEPPFDIQPNTVDDITEQLAPENAPGKRQRRSRRAGN